MKQLFLSLGLTIVALHPVFSQLETKGWWTRNLINYQYLHQPDKPGGATERTYHRIFTQPEVGYVLNKHWMIGIVGQYEFRTDRYDVPQAAQGVALSEKRYWGAGPLIRHYLKIAPKVYFMSEVFAFWARETNEEEYLSFGQSIITQNAKNQVGFGSNPSFTYFLTRDIGISITFANIGYYSDRDGTTFTFAVNPQQWLLGVEWYFENPRKNRGATGR